MPKFTDGCDLELRTQQIGVRNQQYKHLNTDNFRNFLEVLVSDFQGFEHLKKTYFNKSLKISDI